VTCIFVVYSNSAVEFGPGRIACLPVVAKLLLYGYANEADSSTVITVVEPNVKQEVPWHTGIVEKVTGRTAAYCNIKMSIIVLVLKLTRLFWFVDLLGAFLFWQD
jgi:hypothetical protein